MARKKQAIQCEFNSVAEFVEYANANRRAGSHGFYYNLPDFCPVPGVEAVELGMNGDPANAAALFNAVAAVKSAGDGELSALIRDVNGEFFDVGDAVAGVPDCWYSGAPHKAKRNIDIAFNFIYHYGMTPDEVRNRGAALVTLIDALSAGGYLPNITMFCTVEKYGKVCKPIIHIANNPLDLDAVAFAACNPAMCRRIYFAYQEFCFNRDNCNGYGPVTRREYSEDNRAADDPPMVFFDYGIPSNNHYQTAKTTRARVEEILQQLADGERFIEA